MNKVYGYQVVESGEAVAKIHETKDGSLPDDWFDCPTKAKGAFQDQLNAAKATKEAEEKKKASEAKRQATLAKNKAAKEAEAVNDDSK